MYLRLKILRAVKGKKMIFFQMEGGKSMQLITGRLRSGFLDGRVKGSFDRRFHHILLVESLTLNNLSNGSVDPEDVIHPESAFQFPGGPAEG